MRNFGMLRSLALLGLLNAQCAPLESNGTHTRESTDGAVLEIPEGTTATVKAESDGVLTASLSGSTTETQIMKASAGSNISNVVLAFPAGSLSIAMDISIREAPAIPSQLLLSELQLGSTLDVVSTGAAVEVTPSKAVDLLRPMVLALPLPAGFGLALDPNVQKRLGVLYHITNQDTSQSLVGFVPATELALDANNRLLYPSSYFGRFQVVVFDQIVEKTEKVATVSTHEGIEILLSGMTLPSCGKADIGRTVYVQELGQFQYCAAAGWTVIDLKGPAGPAGAVGPAGSGGTGASRMYVYDANGLKLGKFVGSAGLNSHTVELSNGVYLMLSYGAISAVQNNSQCFFTSSDCSGSCYLNGISGGINYSVHTMAPNLGGAGIDVSDSYKITSFVNASLNVNSSFTSMYGTTGSCTPGPNTLTSYTTVSPFTMPFTSYALPMELRVE